MSAVRPDSPPKAPPATTLAEDWATLWQSESAAFAVDREAYEAACAMLAAWTGLAGALARHDQPERRASASDAPGSAPVAAASDAGGNERILAALDRLAGRMDAIEQRLAGLDKPRKPKVRRPVGGSGEG